MSVRLLPLDLGDRLSANPEASDGGGSLTSFGLVASGGLKRGLGSVTAPGLAPAPISPGGAAFASSWIMVGGEKTEGDPGGEVIRGGLSVPCLAGELVRLLRATFTAVATANMLLRRRRDFLFEEFGTEPSTCRV
jgi:hypothetical protein